MLNARYDFLIYQNTKIKSTIIFNVMIWIKIFSFFYALDMTFSKRIMLFLYFMCINVIVIFIF